MPKTYRARGPQVSPTHVKSANKAPATVASLGVRVRLVPVDDDRERRLKILIKACERLRREWERLLVLASDELREEVGNRRDLLTYRRSSRD